MIIHCWRTPCGAMQRIRCEIDQDLQDVSASAHSMVNWKHYVKTYPWVCLGAAAVLGFLIVPKRSRGDQRRLARPDRSGRDRSSGRQRRRPPRGEWSMPSWPPSLASRFARQSPTWAKVPKDYCGGGTTMNLRNGSSTAPPNGIAKDMGELTHDIVSLAELQFELFRNDCREGLKGLLLPLRCCCSRGSWPPARSRLR